jgi:hypothetical protein
MGRQLNIRSDRAYEIASALSKKQHRSIAAVVEDALAAYQAANETRGETVARWKKMLEQTWAQRNDSDFRIEDLYDPETGLPV